MHHFVVGWGKEGAVQRLARISTGDHFEEQDTHLPARLREGARLLDEGAQVDLS